MLNKTLQFQIRSKYVPNMNELLTKFEYSIYLGVDFYSYLGIIKLDDQTNPMTRSSPKC